MEEGDNGYESFRKKILKVNEKRHHKVKNSWGVKDAFKYYRKSKPSGKRFILSESDFYSIIRTMNNIFREALINGDSVTLPERMGELEIRKTKASVDYVDGELKVKIPVNWDKTLRLWKDDKESFDNKTLVRVDNRDVFRVFYNKMNANYNNKGFYHFRANRDIKQGLKDKILNNEIDAYDLGQVIFKREK